MRFKIAKWAYDEEEDWDGFTVKSRSWGDMTRDPYIAFFTCAVYLNRKQFIENTSIPWYLHIFSKQTKKWHRYLKEPTQKNWDRYDITSDHQDKSKLEFVNVLREMRVWAALEVEFDSNQIND